MWFAETIDVYDFEQIRSEGLGIIEEADQGLKEFLLKTLKDSDFNITGYTFEVMPVMVEDLKQSGMPDAIAELLRRQGKGKDIRLRQGTR